MRTLLKMLYHDDPRQKLPPPLTVQYAFLWEENFLDQKNPLHRAKWIVKFYVVNSFADVENVFALLFNGISTFLGYSMPNPSF